MSDREKLPILGNGKSPELSEDVTVIKEKAEKDETSRSITTEAVKPENGNDRNRILLVINSICFILVTVVAIVLIPMTTRRVVDIGGSVYTVQLVAMVLSLVISFSILIVHKYINEKSLRFRPEFSDILRMLYMGLLNALCVVLMIYGGLPSRTAPYFFSILQTAAIPMTVLCKYFMLRQIISRVRLLCVAIVVCGIIVSMIPTFITGSGRKLAAESVLEKILWPLGVAASFIPFTILLLYVEKLSDDHQHTWPVLNFSTQLGSTIVMLSLFWVDILPGFGLSSSIQDFDSRLSRGMTCFLFVDTSCASVTWFQWMFSLCYSVQYSLLFQLLFISEGAVYSQIMMGFTLPVSTLFWTLFEDNVYLRWNPHYSMQTLWIAIGLLIMMPAVICYDYFSCKETVKSEEEYSELKTK